MAKPKNASWDFPIPLIYPRTYLAIAEEHGLQGKELMRQAGLKVRDLSDAQQSFSMVEMDRLLQVIVAALGDIGIGFEVGWRLPPTAYGSFGYALLCSSTVEEALKICLRYWHLIGKGLAVTADIQDKICVIDFVPQIPISSEIDRRIMVEA
ncbi:MAG TPA: AraC family transcriptional regulator ligand-binding domain-containing protein, partial [Pseudomonadales bacterium]|nr:AraC family transcriptional regulator ligand-binding domain-containing protein [Pseudomonadales bacterium]